jgi:hypothetical protein
MVHWSVREHSALPTLGDLPEGGGEENKSLNGMYREWQVEKRSWGRKKKKREERKKNYHKSHITHKK